MFTVYDSVGFFSLLSQLFKFEYLGVIFNVYIELGGFFYFKLFSSDRGILIFRCNVLSCNRRQDGGKYLVSIKK